MDTIFALASARGRSGVAVVRVSGPRAWAAAAALCGKLPVPREAAYRRLRNDGEVIDDGLVILFEAGHSFTGEQTAEFQIHGSTASCSALLSCLGAMPGLRHADAGEFTRRALENGRLDLTQVEGLADLIEAETEAQRKQALRVMAGAIGEKAAQWRQLLVRAAALVEATIDFADEDLPDDMSSEIVGLLQAVAQGLAQEKAGFRAAERVRDGFVVAIVGKPNVGKSTLLNALAGRDVALTSEHAGTTRDVIEVRFDLGGLAVTFLDTAGLRATDDVVERMGVDRALDRARSADLRVFLLERGDRLPMPGQPGDVVARAKADLEEGAAGGVAGAEHDLAVSGLTGLGVDALLERIDEELRPRTANASLAVRERQRAAIIKGSAAVDRALAGVQDGGRVEFLSEDIREALRSLDFLVGKVDVEDLLGEIFASFCIGK